MKQFYATAAAILVFAVAPLHAQEEADPFARYKQAKGMQEAHQDRFALFNQCRTMGVNALVTGTTAGFDFTSERVRELTENRLRVARLFAEEEPLAFLEVLGIVAGDGFGIVVRYVRWLHDPHADAIGAAGTWVHVIAGTHGNDVDGTLYALSEVIDKFILEYQRFNDPWECFAGG